MSDAHGQDDPVGGLGDGGAALADVRRMAEQQVVQALRRPTQGAAPPDSVEQLLIEVRAYQRQLETQNEQLRQIQAALEASRNRYKHLYDQAPVGYLTVGPDGLIVEANRMAGSLFGLAPQDAVGRRLAELVAADDLPALQEQQSRLLQGDRPQSFELRLASPGPAPLWASVQMSMVTDEISGQLQCRVAMVDISERVRMQDGLARMAAVVGSTEDAIVSRDLDGCVTSWNDGAARLFGVAAAEMLGRTMHSLVPEDRQAEEEQLLRKLRDGDKVAHLESERLARDGRAVPLSMSLAPIRDDRGSVIGSALIAHDISERRRADRLLQERLRQLDVLSNAGQALILGGQAAAPLPDDLLEQMRAAVGSEICLNYRLGEQPDTLELLSSHGLSDGLYARLMQVPINDSLCGLVAQRQAHLIINRLRTSALPQARVLKESGALCYAGFPLHAHGHVYGVAAFASTTRDRFRDADLQVIQTVCDQISAMLERSRLLEELHASEQTLKQADRAKDAFIATLAHELRNPLAPIRNVVGILRQSDMRDPEQLHWCRDVIDRQVVQMTHLLEDLLDVSRLTRNKIELRRERMDLLQAIEQAVEATQPLLQSHRHLLALDLPAAPVLLFGDLTRLTQVFANLLNNAAKYTPPGGRITLAVRREGAQVRVAVADNGIGIAAAELPAVFEMFTQLAPAPGRTGSGLGIGLALSRGIVELHGGALQAHSPGPGLGSEFMVRLPAEAPSQDGSAPADESAAAPVQRKRRVLVVDDNVDSAETLSAMLVLYGLEVRTAFDGEEALRTIGEWLPDAAVLDIGMPGMDGHTLCRHIRALPGARQPVLIACTGWGQDSDRAQALDAGFDFHLVKPVDPVALLHLLQQREPAPGVG